MSEKVRIYSVKSGKLETMDRMVKADPEWRKLLTPEQYAVTRGGGTEPPFRNEYVDNKEKGVYLCSNCGIDLFTSDTKYESGTGWPSFWKPVSGDNIITREDSKHMMIRTEVLCARCFAHLGHVFDDGPAPTHKRYCMNSASLRFVKQ